MKKHRLLAGMLAVLLMLASFTVIACGDDDEESSDSGADTAAEDTSSSAIKSNADNKGVTVTIGSKNFTEQKVLGEIYAQGLEAAGYTVQKELNLGDEKIALKSLEGGEISAYPEYTGTALTSFFDVELEAVPRDQQEAYQQAQAAYAEDGITALPPTPFENTYRIGMLNETAQKLGNPTKISDLEGRAGELSISGFPECRQRTDCLLGVEQTYGLKFKKFVPSDSPYATLDNGDADVAFVFTTDGPLSSGKYVVLEDDKNVFPPYNITFAVRDEAAKKLGPEGQKVVTDVQKYMTAEIMQELNARVDLDKQKREVVAADYLKQFGFTS